MRKKDERKEQLYNRHQTIRNKHLTTFSIIHHNKEAKFKMAFKSKNALGQFTKGTKHI